MIKNFTLLVLFSCFFVLSSCNRADKYTQFYLDYNTEITIPRISMLGVSLIEIADLVSLPTQTRAETSFQANGTNSSLVESIELESIVLTFVDPATANFDFMESIEIYISTDSLPEIEIAELDEIPYGLTTITLEIEQERLTEYIKSDQFKLRAIANFRRETRDTRRLNVATRFFIDAKIMGL